ncbi:MAG: ComEC/Rec2 family competence protein [Candidatus Yanofskybacteria bacterium]|nr:ComEC/Rec2 family competence protein [Candidatus Yanofskybacteria bacterium]
MHKSQVLFYLLLAFLGGIFIASFIPTSYEIIFVLLIAGIAALALFGYQKTFSARGLYGSILFLALVFGMGRFAQMDLSSGILIQFADRFIKDKPVQTTLRGYVTEEPAINGQTSQFNFRAKEIILPNKVLPADEVVKVTTRGAVFYKIGDTLEIQGPISRPNNLDPVRGREGSQRASASNGIDYVKHLKRSGINTVILFPAVSEIEYLNIRPAAKAVIGFQKTAATIKNNFEQAVNNSLVEPNASYVNGILLGSRQNIPEDLKEAFNKTGTTHILAISGYNIMIISWAVLMGLIFFFKRRAAFWLSVGVIIMFVILTGASASVVRAAIMGLILSFAHGYGRLYDQRNSIILAGGIMVFHNPFTLVFDIGFQLSFAAALGIIYLYPWIDRKLKNFPKAGGFKELLLMTLSAQITVAPLLIYYFGGFSPLSLPTNVLILPFVPAAMFLGFLAGIGGMIFASLGQIIGHAAWAVTTYQIEVVKFFAALAFSFWLFLCYQEQ